MDSGFNDMANMQETGRENHNTHLYTHTQSPAKSNLQESWAGILKCSSLHNILPVSECQTKSTLCTTRHTLSALEAGVPITPENTYCSYIKRPQQIKNMSNCKNSNPYIISNITSVMLWDCFSTPSPSQLPHDSHASECGFRKEAATEAGL